ncbi:MAG: BamA/TamA family outer membrane protein [Cyclobacteriaceae bacterium]
MKYSVGFILVWMLTFVKAQDSTKQKMGIVAYPVFSYTPETRLEMGAVSFIVIDKEAEQSRQYNRPTVIAPFVLYSLNKQMTIGTDYEWYSEGGFNLTGDLLFQNFPNKYYGIGNETLPDIFERFTNQYLKISGRALYGLSENLFMGVSYDFRHNNIRDLVPEGLMEAQLPPGINGGRNMGIGPSVIFDTRDNTLFPSKGLFINASIELYSKLFASDYQYIRYLIDARYFKAVWPTGVLGVQFRTTMSSGGDVPFYRLNKIGGDDFLRGIDHENLYQDRQAAFLQLEGRQHLFWRIKGVLFTGLGQVYGSPNQFDWNNTKAIYGIGARFKALKDQDLNIRVDYGRTFSHQSGFYVTIKEAF